MASGIFYPLVSGDDGKAGFGGVDKAENYDNIGQDYGGIKHLFFRFPNITIPPSSSITSAKLVVTTYAARWGNVYSNLYANDVDDIVSTPVDNTAFYALALTSAVVAWDFNSSDWSTGGEQHDSPEIKTIIQPVISRGDWASGNALMLVWKDDGSATGSYAMISMIDYLSGAQKPELHITWTTQQQQASVNEIASWNPDDKGSNITLDEAMLTATHA